MKIKNRGIYLAVLCSITYGIAYMARINLSAAVSKMAVGFGTTEAAIGVFGTVQALIYAGGQLINGYFISRHSPRKILLAAILGSGIVNILMGLTNQFLPALLFWTLNAFFQSFIWTAIVRIVGTYPESQSDTSLMWLVLVIPIGYILSWSVIGSILDNVWDWHPYFLIPGILMAALIPFWYKLPRTCPETETLAAIAPSRKLSEIFRYIFDHHVTTYCVISVLLGIIRDGIFFWAPLLLARILTGKSLSPYFTVAIIPLTRVPATIGLRSVIRHSRNYPKISAGLYLLTAVFSIAMLPLDANAETLSILLIVMLTFISCMIGSLYSVYVPVSYTQDNMSAPIAGILDAAIYLGASISTYALGHILSGETLKGAAILWAAASIAGVGLSILAGKQAKKERISQTLAGTK